ncbi:hypothetical protein CANMA_003039 [Candida margitis]|uniref:uncharacterized protein n=1 Tax=Candida margitis TaxID=1775924 RepID=UPI00222746C9|nr:uncharacterized protein CANMA_003039 [Candida margitis]KAI5967492.1 hypothetical protein CANMA_003039 [Candida margitis]
MNENIGYPDKKKVSHHHSISKNNKLNDLKSIKFFNLYNQQVDESGQTSPHKRFGRRRSTLTTIPTISDVLENEYNDLRKLIKFSKERILDTLITIHLTKSDTVLYVSDVSYGDADPQFTIQLSHVPAPIHKCVIKLWSGSNNQWSLLCRYKVDLNKLKRESEVLDDDAFDMFKDNAICMKLSCGWYTFPDMLVARNSALEHSTEPKLKAINSYTFDQLRSINNITKSIKELDVSKIKLKQQIHKYIQDIDYNNANNISALLDELNYKCNALEQDIKKVKAGNEAIKSQIYNVNQKTDDANELQSRFENLRELVKDKFGIYDHEIEYVKKSRNDVKNDIKQRLKDYVSIITEIIPIRDISFSCFSILGFEFPHNLKSLKEICYYNASGLKNSYYEPSFDSESQWHEFTISQVNACLSLIVQLLSVLSDITQTPLLYKMVLFGSQSFIIDESKIYPIAGKNPLVATPPYKFPLYFDSKDVNNEKVLTSQGSIIMNQEFEYGLKLLSRNISRLINYVKEDIYDDSSSEAIPSDCQDNFLWNLKYLELLITA